MMVVCTPTRAVNIRVRWRRRGGEVGTHKNALGRWRRVRPTLACGKRQPWRPLRRIFIVLKAMMQLH